MALSRRTWFQAAASLPLLAIAARARAEEVDDTTDYPMDADPATVAALDAAAAAHRGVTGIIVHVLPTAPALLVPQMTHQIQNDIVMARQDVIADLDRAGYFVEGTPRPRFADRLVLAGLNEAGLARSIAFTDITAGRPRDEAAVLDALGLGNVPRVGCIDSLDAAAMAVSGAAGAALVRTSDLAANPGLKKLRDVPDDVAAPDIFIATVTRSPRRPKPEAFVAFLASPRGSAILARFGLEKLA
jgi:hypothetical protein